MSYVDDLNPQQKEAVLYNQGPMLILAGAGSGKTRTLISKIAYLIDHEGMFPGDILAVTFTNRAAMEMRDRLTKFLDYPTARAVNAGTFHSLCARFLRPHAHLVGLKSSFTIFDDSESFSLIKRMLEEKQVDKDEVNAGAVSYFIDEVKNKGHYRQKKGSKFADNPFYEYFLAYEEALEENNSVDFNSIITKMIQLLESNKEARESFQNKFKFILVDEFQDTNIAQMKLIQLLVGPDTKICAVGDPDQSIYSFRFAEIDNVMKFDQYFPGAKDFKLEENYRSTKNIVDAATAVIKRNIYRKDKVMFTSSEEGEKIRVYQCTDGRKEAEFIGQEIRKLLSKKVAPKEIAIFYRNNSQSRALEEVFRLARIPYELIGGQRFYERKEIKDLLAYMRLLVNSSDTVSFMRVINTPSRGIGDKAMNTLLEEAKRKQESLFEFIMSREFHDIKLTAKTKDALEQLALTYEQAMAIQSTGSLLELYEHFLEGTGYQDYLEKSKKVEDQARLDNLKEFKSSLKGLNIPLAEFIESLTLDQKQEDATKDERIKLLTMHSSKGLEFDHVFVIALEEGLFPSPQSMGRDLEEERRLFYVSLTRAKKELNLFHALTRVMYGQFQNNPRSRFLYEIPTQFCKFFRI